jgi:hypothetical protein
MYIRLIDPGLPTNFTFIRQYKGKKPIYDVEMPSMSESRAIRDGFGQFWSKKSGKRMPDGLKGVTIANSTTFPTRVRVRLLKELARKHSIANPELSCFVTNYFPRPELKIRSRRNPMVTLSYTDAVVRLPHHLSNEFLIELYEYARSVLPDVEIVKRFLVLSPDLLKPGSGHADSSSMSLDDQPPSNENPPSSHSEPQPSGSQNEYSSTSGTASATAASASPAPATAPTASPQETADDVADVNKKNRGRYSKGAPLTRVFLKAPSHLAVFE